MLFATCYNYYKLHFKHFELFDMSEQMLLQMYLVSVLVLKETREKRTQNNYQRRVLKNWKIN